MDTSNNASQIKLLQQKLQSAKQALTDINEDRNAKLQTLLEFIQSLSLACKGQNLELDNKLAKLRHQLTNYEKLDDALPDLLEVEQLLKKQYHLIMSQLEQSRAGLTRITRQIQRINLPEAKLKTELNYFKKGLDKPLHTVWEYLPKIEQIIQFQEHLLSATLDPTQKEQVLPKHQQLAQELTELITEIDFNYDQQDQIQTLQEQLGSNIDIDHLLEAYQTILGLLLGNIAQEKCASQEFLATLNDALSAVKNVVTDSYHQTQLSADLKSQLNAEINQQVNSVQNSITDINELQQLKTRVSDQLAGIRTALTHKESLEHKEQALMRKAIEAMRKELTELNEEANSYKEKLIEQQKINQLDPLTQLPNRAALEDRMAREMRRFKRHGNPLWLAVVDIDHFKKINDTFGHSCGDKTLQVIAMALKNALRDTEFVARFGGEEFVLLIPNVSAKDISQLLNRVREKIKTIPFKFKNQKITVTVSIGAAQLNQTEAMEEVFERADAALYRAKNANRDRVELDS
ncbi:diguanylate cyclase [Shewanella sp. NFH-SH190041]|uniref:GGDEF domain-containing protein n=1 Tax=Shewanella sp. NFH-SH190041 TaxID=2950245 RepID=UPI0021C29025|nr:GGDEF domain-containing protein [Shewanella sp. NFH-SH190041]BDM65218.1 diguanylate cyclase [Shewanella sp. NFH-SH190041]